MKNEELRDHIKKMRDSGLYDNLTETCTMTDEIHESYKEKMKTIFLIYAGQLVWLFCQQQGSIRESTIIEMTNDFVEKTFKKIE